MSKNENFLTPQHDFDILFVPSWRAGVSTSQCLTKSLKNDDLENVNIVKTCEKLCLALNENSKSNHDISQHVNDVEKQCVVRKPNMPFRTFSNIWFGTLKIYQQQVNTLFRLSRDLFSRSCNYSVKHIEARKRKSSLTSNALVKKRCYTTTYSELLDDLEKLTQEPLQKSLTECPQNSSGTITQIHIREITIREISSSTFSALDVFDEDSGFGEATHEEIAEFLNFVGDNSSYNRKRTATKRKSICAQGSPTSKRCYINGSSFETLCNENTPPIGNNLKTSSLKRSVTPVNITNAFDDKKILENENFLQLNCPGNINFIESFEIKKENLSVENEQFSKIVGSKKKKLIIDECTKIDISEIMEEMKTFKVIRKVPRKRNLKSYKCKKYISALELLTSFNRRSLNLTLFFKQKFYLSRDQFERDYLNLLRDIFKISYNEKLASEIYPQWRYFEDTFQKLNKKRAVNNSIKQNRFTNNLNEALNPNVIEENDINEYQRIQSIRDYNKMKSLNSCIYNEWRPYGVMEKLLNLWRFNQTNKIGARTLFKLAENQFERALGFNSLLNLSNKQFVILTNFPESIELQNVLMGGAIKRNIRNK